MIIGSILEVGEGRLHQMNQGIRKLMTIHKALHPRDDINSLYESRKERGRRIASIKDSGDASIEWLEKYNKEQKKSDYNNQKQ